MKILLWGTGKLAAKYMRYEYFCAHEIIGFVDTFKKHDLFMNYPVYYPTQVKDLLFDAMVVCVRNSNEDILDACIKENVDLAKVFFIGYDLGFGAADEKYVEQLPDLSGIKGISSILYLTLEEQAVRRNYLLENANEDKFQDTSFISNVGDEHVIAWLPVELLFSERAEDNVLDVYTEAWIEQNREWENHPIICFGPYRNLFRFFMQGQEFPAEYCRWWQRLFTSRGMSSGMTDEELIEKRFREFMIMQNELNTGMDFFIKHPAIGKWNEKGYFNLLDGHHRTIFLYYSGLRKIPVQIPRKDYECWCNMDAAKAVHAIATKQERFEFYQPILHPYFLTLHPYRENYAKSRLHHILEYLGHTRFKGKSVLDIGACLGYFGQMFARMGAEVTMIDHDPIHFELLTALNKMLHIECEAIMQPFEEFDSRQKFDIAVMLTVFYPYMEDEEVKMKFLNKINAYINHALIWESGDEPDLEKDLIMKHTKFKMFKRLCVTYATGKFREMGIFFAGETAAF